MIGHLRNSISSLKRRIDGLVYIGKQSKKNEYEDSNGLPIEPTILGIPGIEINLDKSKLLCLGLDDRQTPLALHVGDDVPKSLVIKAKKLSLIVSTKSEEIDFIKELCKGLNEVPEIKQSKTLTELLSKMEAANGAV